MITTRALLASLACLALVACEEKPAPTPAVSGTQKKAAPAPEAAAPAPEKPAPPAGATHASGATFAVAGLTFATPEGWNKVTPANPMRLAELHTAAAGGAVAVFSVAGGDASANISRWSNQFQGAKATTAERTVAGLKVHTVDIAGTYSGMNEAAQNNYALHGAIIETGGESVFVKMTGPEDAVKAAAPAFDAMIEGMTK